MLAAFKIISKVHRHCTSGHYLTDQQLMRYKFTECGQQFTQSCKLVTHFITISCRLVLTIKLYSGLVKFLEFLLMLYQRYVGWVQQWYLITLLVRSSSVTWVDDTVIYKIQQATSDVTIALIGRADVLPIPPLQYVI